MATSQVFVIESRPVETLSCHELLHRIFLPPDEEDIDKKVSIINKSGQPYPIHILPDATVLQGFCLLCAAKKAKLAKVEVAVHYDWADIDPAVIGLHVIALHQDSVPPDLLDTARMFTDWRQWRRTLPRRPGLRKWALRRYNEDLDKEVEVILGKSTRTLERYEMVRKMPEEIQQACLADKLPMTLAVKIPSLDKEQQRQLFAVIEGGADVKSEVIKALGERARPPQKMSFDAALRMLDQVRQAVEHATPQLKFLRPDTAAVLDAAKMVIDRAVQLPRKSTTAEQDLQKTIAECKEIASRRA